MQGSVYFYNSMESINNAICFFAAQNGAIPFLAAYQLFIVNGTPLRSVPASTHDLHLDASSRANKGLCFVPEI